MNIILNYFILSALVFGLIVTLYTGLKTIKLI